MTDKQTWRPGMGWRQEIEGGPMSKPDTSAEAVETLAGVFARRGPMGGGSGNGVIYGTIAATLRALLAERDEAQREANEGRQAEADADRERDVARAERDAARAQVARLTPKPPEPRAIPTDSRGWGEYGASTVTGPRPPSLQALEQRVDALEHRMRNR